MSDRNQQELERVARYIAEHEPHLRRITRATHARIQALIAAEAEQQRAAEAAQLMTFDELRAARGIDDPLDAEHAYRAHYDEVLAMDDRSTPERRAQVVQMVERVGGLLQARGVLLTYAEHTSSHGTRAVLGFDPLDDEAPRRDPQPFMNSYTTIMFDQIIQEARMRLDVHVDYVPVDQPEGWITLGTAPTVDRPATERQMEDECGICLDPPREVGEVVTFLPCEGRGGHWLHTECAAGWFASRGGRIACVFRCELRRAE